MGYVPNTADIITNIVQGSANVESIIRANPLNQLATATGNYSMGSNSLRSVLAGILGTDAPNLTQMAENQRAFVVSGCVWTGDALGSTRAASMTSGTVMIKGILLTVAAVTSRTFAASSDTYVDLADNGDGTANITYTTVANNGLSPVLPSSGTLLNTIRIAVLTVGASNIAAATNIIQGTMSASSTPATGVAAGSSTVAAPSTGQAINALTSNQLAVAAGANFSTGGGWIQVDRTSAPVQTCTLQYTGVSSNNLTGITSGNVISGTATGTVTTGDAVRQIVVNGAGTPGAGPIGLTDMLGNPIYPTMPYPRIIGYASYANAFTTTSTAAIPIPGLIAPFVVPTGTTSRIRVIIGSNFIGSSATAGTTLTLQAYPGNASSATAINAAAIKTAVASDGDNLSLIAVSTAPLTAGSYTAQMGATQGAAGTLTLGVSFGTTFIFVELV